MANSRTNHQATALAEATPGLPVRRIIKVDTGRMSYKDLRLLLNWQNTDTEDKSPEAAEKSAVMFRQVLDMLDRVVIGGIDDLPIDTMPEVIEAIGAALQHMTAGKQAKN